MKSPSPREAFGDNEVSNIYKCVDYYRSRKADPPYDGKFQQEYENNFSLKMGEEGFACAVSTGSSACFLAIQSLELPKNSSVLVSPVSDSSSLIGILLAGLKPILVDTQEESYNSGLKEFQEAYSSDVSAIYLVHTYGNPCEVEQIVDFCKTKNIKLIEDCSQSPFAKVRIDDNGKYIGNFGDVAAFSTMYRKTLHSCSSGGIIYTRNHNIYKKVIEYSDRGRRKWDPEYNAKDIGNIDVLSLNYNTNEISCAIAQASLARVDKTIQERRKLLKMLQEGLGDLRKYIKVMTFSEYPSPFLVPIIFTSEGLKHKNELFKIFDNEGIPYAASYQCFAHEWSFTKKYLKSNLWNFLLRRGKKNIYSANAERLKARTFNLFLHEGYDDEYMTHVLKCFRQLS